MVRGERARDSGGEGGQRDGRGAMVHGARKGKTHERTTLLLKGGRNNKVAHDAETCLRRGGEGDWFAARRCTHLSGYGMAAMVDRGGGPIGRSARVCVWPRRAT